MAVEVEHMHRPGESAVGTAVGQAAVHATAQATHLAMSARSWPTGHHATWSTAAATPATGPWIPDSTPRAVAACLEAATLGSGHAEAAAPHEALLAHAALAAAASDRARGFTADSARTCGLAAGATQLIL